MAFIPIIRRQENRETQLTQKTGRSSLMPEYTHQRALEMPSIPKYGIEIPEISLPLIVLMIWGIMQIEVKSKAVYPI
jgi:hypothetical protein